MSKKYIYLALFFISSSVMAGTINARCRHEQLRTEFNELTGRCQIPSKTVIIVHPYSRYHEELYVGPVLFGGPDYMARPYARSGRIHRWSVYR